MTYMLTVSKRLRRKGIEPICCFSLWCIFVSREESLHATFDPTSELGILESVKEHDKAPMQCDVRSG